MFLKRVRKLLAGLIYLFTLTTTYAQSSQEQLYIQRLASLKSPVGIVYHPEVKKHIDEYLSNPEKTKELIGLSKYYFPLLEKALKQKGVPTDLKYLAVALSELNPLIQTSTGASGVWLVHYNVSKMYKLKVNSYIDERRDPNKSSAVVATHLKDLFSIYRQWPLAIAGFHSSPIMLNKSIRMAGNSMHFWDIYPFIPEATRDAYPKFVAAAYICNFYKEHGIKAAQPAIYVETDTVTINKWLSFQQVSSVLEISVEELRTLNPIFKKDVIPYNLDGYALTIPKSKSKLFGLLKDSVYKQLPSPEEFNPVIIQKESPPPPKESSNEKATEQSNLQKFEKKRVYYTVKRGDFLNHIADWFDVETDEIKSWNRLKSDRLITGQKLTIWVNQSKTGYYKRINTMSPVQKKNLAQRD
jgi:membrane-bound lytic murein transglycosylase D